MSKNKLKLLINQDSFDQWKFTTLGMNYMLGSLMSSDVFDVGNHNEVVDVAKGHRGMILYLNDIKIYLDFWEYLFPSNSVQVYEQNFDIIIKLQHRYMTLENYLEACKKKSIMPEMSNAQKTELFNKIVPWSFFPSQYLLEYAAAQGKTPDQLEPLKDERVGFFCGRNWRTRRRWNGRLEKDGFDIFTHHGNNMDNRPLEHDDFMHKMRTSKFGLVLPGRSSVLSEAKNRREIDYMLLKKPIIMPYTPNYHNPLIPNKHYILIDRHTKYDRLDKRFDLDKMVDDAYDWYMQNASPKGLVKTFLEIAQGIRPSHPDFNHKIYKLV